MESDDVAELKVVFTTLWRRLVGIVSLIINLGEASFENPTGRSDVQERDLSFLDSVTLVIRESFDYSSLITDLQVSIGSQTS